MKTVGEETPSNIGQEKQENAFDDLDKGTPIDENSESGKEAENASYLPGITRNTTRSRQVHGEVFTEEELIITPEEKSAFIDSMITGERYRQSMTIFGGRVSIVIRSRTADETQAMYAYMRHELSGHDKTVSSLETDMSYILLVAQLEEMNGVQFPEMKVPLTFTMEGGKENPPGWMEDLRNWTTKAEGLTSALIKQIQLFEYKYWTMVAEAKNKNFWNSDTSTGA